MKKPTELHLVQEREAPAPDGIASRPAERPGTRENAWRNLVRWLARHPVKSGSRSR
jgi:hypothetical protein